MAQPAQASNMAENDSQGRRFFCREWAWAKLWACVEQRPSAKTCGALLLGGPGTGKTALCSQLVAPTITHGRHAVALQARVLAYHFCHSHNVPSLSVPRFILRLVEQLSESPLVVGYSAKIQTEEIAAALDPKVLQKDPDEALRKAVIFPLLEIDPPDRTLMLVVDSIDEGYLQNSFANPNRDIQQNNEKNIESTTGPSTTITELLAAHHHLLPQWILLVITARRGSRVVTRQFAGFRRIALDDPRRSHVVRDVQQYILCRLDREPALRHHLSRETAEMLNQLHIKSNGCFLYLEKVLDGVAEGWVTLREIRDIPGTLNGLYLWLCQRLYPRRHFQKVAPLLAVASASREPISPQELREAVETHIPTLTEEEWTRRWTLLKRVLCPYAKDMVLMFHHSFAEWLLDVKHCTQKYLVDVSQGHGMLAMKYTINAKELSSLQVQDFAFHLSRMTITAPLQAHHLPLWLVGSGVDLNDCFKELIEPKDQKAFKLLQEAGAKLPEDTLTEPNDPEDDDDDEEEEDEEIFENEEKDGKASPDIKYEKLNTGEEIINSTQLLISDDNANEKEKQIDGETEEPTKDSEQENQEPELSEEKLIDNRVSVDKNDNGEEDEITMRSELPPEPLPIEALVHTDNLCINGRRHETPVRNGSAGRSSCRTSTGGRQSTGGRCSSSGQRSSSMRGSSEYSNSSSRRRERRRRRHREDPLYPYLRGGPVDQLDAAGRTLLHTAAHQGDASLVRVLLERGADHSLQDRGGQTPLNLAARHGQAEVVAILLSHGADPDHADDDGWTALRSAAWGGHGAVVAALLDGGAQVDLADADGRTALRAAAWGGHEEVVAGLLQHGAALNRADAEGRTPLIAAAYMGHAEIVEALLTCGADVDHADIDGRTALSVAALCVPASEGHGRVVTTLLERGAHVDHQDRDGLTPLLVAAFEGHTEVCELLLEFEADVDHVDRSGRTPLLAAASMGHATVVERLLFWGCYVDHIDAEGRTVLSIAAAQGSQETVRSLLDRGLDETHRDNAGWTPLHYAAFEGHRGVCEALLEAGARVSEVDNDGKHALVLAAQEGHAAVVSTLLDAGASIHHTSHDGRSALRVAALEGHKDVVHLLLCRNADLHYKDADGRSTLYLLALENRLVMAQFLLESGADVESTDLEGRTPLHVTAWQGHSHMVSVLLAHGARVDAVDLERRTPLQSAAWQGHAEIVRILLENGAAVDHTCSQGATALSIAAQEGHEDCVAILLQYGANPSHSDRCGRTAIKVALKGGHLNLARMLEDQMVEIQQGHVRHNRGGTSSASAGSGSTSDTKPCSALLCPGLTASPAESPESTFEKRRSCTSLGQHSSSKSSGNLTSSTRSSGGQHPTSSRDPNSHFQSHHAPPPAPSAPPVSAMSPVLSFTQQLQQCGRGRSRRQQIPPQPALTPLDEPSSPIYASPPQSPQSDGPDGRSFPQRINPVVALLEEEYSLPLYHSGTRRPVPSAPPAAITPEGGNRRTSAGFGVPPPNIPNIPGSNSNVGVGAGSPSTGFTFTQDQHMRIILGTRSPEPRPKKNGGIVTNPSLKAAHAKAAHILRNGLHSRPRQPHARPNGLPLKKETPL